ncbi:hypothetical protein P691DRAFT_537765 [Macrolepiota fuliginosa MF-IS2]|uniref:Alpha-type protein kinase domain-containing protein n=1 Tax=Macrolepiota fuliginosa MF-IS2 TaxID=1400762 RepID=A0A9P5XE58_9AGAR|nr:hypothetical protein P691DRAFT_537765 [Macrolepiota fuliginosa MF-IS2]
MTFCDLQGISNKTGTMCLIDPQAHTRALKQSQLYQDQGEGALERLKKEHNHVCQKNIYYNRLELCNLVVKNDSKVIIGHGQRRCVDYILNDE